ncbi:YuzD family protein [Metabacillus arenae]|uniref:YuzD family protein n=1 Tax=Metabacillus arenae TaxID=2771434 RepID=A0A926NIW4_9BACI|nr:YuzD family protein [Metabacillus arenae]MBD1380828.1 YuzD family protein [Metabacillus arenae]
MKKEVEVCVYGTEVLCPSCVNLPSSRETYEWLQAAISRKYPDQPFQMDYIDIHQPPEDELKKSFSEKVLNDEYFYPLIVIEGNVVGEGNPRLKVIYKEMEKHGYIPVA